MTTFQFTAKLPTYTRHEVVRELQREDIVVVNEAKNVDKASVSARLSNEVSNHEVE